MIRILLPALLIPAFLVLDIRPADALSYRNHFRIVSKTVSIYKELPYSKVRWKVLGRSTKNRKVYYKEFGSGDTVTMVIGGLHGDEPASIISAIRLADYIRRNPKSIRNRVVIIPCVNPDGLYRASRTNARRVDINRNFPSDSWSPEYKAEHNHPGKDPGSEVETQLVMKAIGAHRPALIVQIHQPFNAIFPTEKVPPELMERISALAGIPVKYDLGYETPGSLEHYDGYREHNILGITYELGAVDKEPDYRKIVASLIEAVNYRPEQ